jgi:hypothetical protein
LTRRQRDDGRNHAGFWRGHDDAQHHSCSRHTAQESPTWRAIHDIHNYRSLPNGHRHEEQQEAGAEGPDTRHQWVREEPTKRTVHTGLASRSDTADENEPKEIDADASHTNLLPGATTNTNQKSSPVCSTQEANRR